MLDFVFSQVVEKYKWGKKKIKQQYEQYGAQSPEFESKVLWYE